MELSGALLSAAFLSAIVVISQAMSIPAVNDLQPKQLQNNDGNENEARATWLNTRDVEDEFVQLVEMSLHQLASEGRVNQDLLFDNNSNNENTETEADADSSLMPQKRGRFQGFCFRKTSTGRFLPYVCWKQDKRRR